MTTFENAAYRYHSCGCYRAGVTRIDARGPDPCPEHAPRQLSQFVALGAKLRAFLTRGKP